MNKQLLIMLEIWFKSVWFNLGLRVQGLGFMVKSLRFRSLGLKVFAEGKHCFAMISSFFIEQDNCFHLKHTGVHLRLKLV